MQNRFVCGFSSTSGLGDMEIFARCPYSLKHYKIKTYTDNIA